MTCLTTYAIRLQISVEPDLFTINHEYVCMYDAGAHVNRLHAQLSDRSNLKILRSRIDRSAAQACSQVVHASCGALQIELGKWLRVREYRNCIALKQFSMNNLFLKTDLRTC